MKIQKSFIVNAFALFSLSVGVFIAQKTNEVEAASTFSNSELPTTNLKCYDADLEKFKVNKGVNYQVGQNKGIKRLCMGYFPNFPSTKVEGGLEPFYYAKYRFFPEPMPIYKVTNTAAAGLPEGFYQTFELDRRFETLPGDPSVDISTLTPHPDDLFLLYPHNYHHETENDGINTDIKGPYQGGYNSFYHNLYRGRYFPKSIDFEFYVIQPDRDGEVPTAEELEDISDPDNSDGTVGDAVFSGVIHYEMPNACFENDVLDFKEECREVEFYFPKGEYDLPSYTYEDSELKVPVTGGPATDNRKELADERLHYKNPGVHILKFKANEQAEYRYQVDEGYDWQTDPRQSCTGGIECLIVKNTDNEKIGWKQIIPSNLRTVPTKYAGRGFDVVPFPNSNSGTGLHYEYVPLAPESTKISAVTVQDDAYKDKLKKHYNFCDINKEAFNRIDEDAYGDILPGENRDGDGHGDPYTDGQKIDGTNCYHNANKNYHFWKYNWSTVRWYKTSLNTPTVPLTFSYTGSQQQWEVPISGKYKIEVWGAQGGAPAAKPQLGGKGGYAKGEINLTSGTDLYLYIGSSAGHNTGGQGYNGGGKGSLDIVHRAYGGGGASDVRVNGTGYKNRIIVAGGGGGLDNGSENAKGGEGGGLQGTAGQYGTPAGSGLNGEGGTQTSSGGPVIGGFGFGGDGNCVDCGGGGGGYYGGGGATAHNGGAGGGSSFISGHPGANAVNASGNHTNQPNHYSGLVFTNTATQQGVRNGDGLIKITYLGP